MNNDGRHDFDFLHGSWNIWNKRLEKRLAGNTNWQEFEAHCEACYPVIGGMGNVDSFSGIFPDGQALEGMTLRIFNPQTQLWSIYWADSTEGKLDPPVLGSFENNVGYFIDLFIASNIHC